MASGTAIYHPEEVRVRESPGTSEQAEFLAGIAHPSICASSRDFLAAQRWVVVASRSQDRRVWCSLFTSAPTFISIPDEHTMRINVLTMTEDPIFSRLSNSSSPTRNIELLAADFLNMRRVMVKGEMEISSGALTVHVREVASFCRKHVRPNDSERSRVWAPTTDAPTVMPIRRHNIILDALQQAWIRTVNCFFIATYNAAGEAECWAPWWASPPCQVVDNRTLLLPCFSDNGMYNTIDNLTHDSRAGLLFLDYEHGTTLQVTGRGQVIHDPAWTARFDRACAVVEFTLDETETIETENATSMRWDLLGYSSYNPAP